MSADVNYMYLFEAQQKRGSRDRLPWRRNDGCSQCAEELLTSTDNKLRTLDQSIAFTRSNWCASTNNSMHSFVDRMPLFAASWRRVHASGEVEILVLKVCLEVLFPSSPLFSRDRIWCILALKYDTWWQQFQWFFWETTYQISCSLNRIKANREHALFCSKQDFYLSPLCVKTTSDKVVRHSLA